MRIPEPRHPGLWGVLLLALGVSLFFARDPIHVSAQVAGGAVPSPADSAAGKPRPAPALGTVAAEIQRVLDSDPSPLGLYASAESRRLWGVLAAAYEARGYAPVWNDAREGFPDAESLFDKMKEAPAHGLDPEDYPVPAVRDLVRVSEGADVATRAKADVALSHLFITYATHLSRGRINPKNLDIQWHLPRRKTDLAQALEQVAGPLRPAAVLDRLAPHRREYADLQRMLRDLRGLQGWPEVPGTFKAERGDTLESLALVRRYLAAVGDLPPGPTGDPRAMDDIVAAGVRNFQQRHGLVADGVIGPRTLAAMRVPPAARLRTVLVNMERWRWLPDTLGTRYIAVNVPSYDMRVTENERTVLSMRVIAGTKGDPTPNFSDAIESLELNPQWHVPSSIATEELLPKIKDDPNYLIAENISVVDGQGKSVDPTTIDWSAVNPGNMPFRFRQEPGGGNPLGSIKFLFPNAFSVYLHDTPNARLFDKDRRAMSHGCIRIEHPIELATYLLGREGRWSKEELEDEVKSGKRRWIDLKEREPIYLFYFTAFVDGEKNPSFREDIYHRDALIDSALAHYRSPYTPPDPPVAELEASPGKGGR